MSIPGYWNGVGMPLTLVDGTTGNQVLFYNGTDWVFSNNDNLILGNGAGNNDPSIGSENVGFGPRALASATVFCQGNTSVGHGGLASLNSGNRNTAVGWDALGALANSSGFNTAVGALALRQVINGNQNVAVGASSMNSMTGGFGNVGVGYETLASFEGTNNVAVGNSAARWIETGSNNVFLGANADTSPSMGGVTGSCYWSFSLV